MCRGDTLDFYLVTRAVTGRPTRECRLECRLYRTSPAKRAYMYWQ